MPGARRTRGARGPGHADRGLPTPGGSGGADPQAERRVAIPVFGSRVSPVLDACRQVLLIEIRGDAVIARTAVPLAAGSLPERADLLGRLKVDWVICAGVSQQLFDLLDRRGIRLIPGIVGELDQVLGAFLAGTLDRPCFQMPGAAPPR